MHSFWMLFSILSALAAIGIWLQAIAFKGLVLIRDRYDEMDWKGRFTQGAICLINLIIGPLIVMLALVIMALDKIEVEGLFVLYALFFINGIKRVFFKESS